MINNKLFQATEYPLEIYNDQPIIDMGFQFFYLDCDTETDFDFPDYSSSYMKVYNERLGRTIKTIPLTRNGNILIVNSTDTDFDDNGKYFYEVIYLMSGGYEQVLRYGILNVI
jgi:hypothetical protein